MKTVSFRFVPFLLIFLLFLVPPAVGDVVPDTADVPPEIQDPEMHRINTVGLTAAGVPYAVHSRSVEEWTQRYVWPQDNANRTGVRWVRFVDEAGHGLRVAAKTPLNVAARPYTDSTLASVTHTYDLRRADAITVHLDAGIHGVGGDDSWGERTHPQYTVPGNESHRLRLWLQPVREEDV